jgi:hypothetical protein
MNVHSSAHNCQLNRLQRGCLFEVAESGVSKTNVEARPAVAYVKLNSTVSVLVLLHVH